MPPLIEVLERDGQIYLVGTSDGPVLLSTILNKYYANGNDEFTSLQTYVHDMQSRRMISGHATLHMISSLSQLNVPPTLIELNVAKTIGNDKTAFIDVELKKRRLAFNSNPRLHLVTVCSDHSGPQLAALKSIATPNPYLISKGLRYQRIGIMGEIFFPPFIDEDPWIPMGDHEHMIRLLARALKSSTFNITFFSEIRDGRKVEYTASISDYRKLRELARDACDFSNSDLDLLLYCDQRPDATNRLFTHKIADLMAEKVNGSNATVLYIKMVCYLMDPFRNINNGTPLDVVRSLAAGLT